MARRIVDAPCDMVQNGRTARWHLKEQRTKMEGTFVRVSRVSNRFWFAVYRELLALWEYSHRRDARIGKIARWFIVVGSEGLLWYIFSVECLVGVFLVELVFFPPKSPR